MRPTSRGSPSSGVPTLNDRPDPDGLLGTAAVAVSELFDVGLLVLDRAAGVLASNLAAARIFSDSEGIRISGQSLVIEDKSVADGLAQALAVVLDNVPSVVSAPASPLPLGPFHARIIPLTDHPGTAVLIVDRLNAISRPCVIDDAAKQFGLTPAESRVAKALAGGKSIDDVARDFQISKFTVRAQLRQIFVKTDTHRQAELVKLLLTPGERR